MGDKPKIVKHGLGTKKRPILLCKAPSPEPTPEPPVPPIDPVEEEVVAKLTAALSEVRPPVIQLSWSTTAEDSDASDAAVPTGSNDIDVDVDAELVPAAETPPAEPTPEEPPKAEPQVIDKENVHLKRTADSAVELGHAETLLGHGVTPESPISSVDTIRALEAKIAELTTQRDDARKSHQIAAVNLDLVSKAREQVLKENRKLRASREANGRSTPVVVLGRLEEAQRPSSTNKRFPPLPTPAARTQTGSEPVATKKGVGGWLVMLVALICLSLSALTVLAIARGWFQLAGTQVATPGGVSEVPTSTPDAPTAVPVTPETLKRAVEASPKDARGHGTTDCYYPSKAKKTVVGAPKIDCGTGIVPPSKRTSEGKCYDLRKCTIVGL